jgi:hypothetical protein
MHYIIQTNVHAVQLLGISLQKLRHQRCLRSAAIFLVASQVLHPNALSSAIPYGLILFAIRPSTGPVLYMFMRY